jgi:hypothetical protein
MNSLQPQNTHLPRAKSYFGLFEILLLIHKPTVSNPEIFMFSVAEFGADSKCLPMPYSALHMSFSPLRILLQYLHCVLVSSYSPPTDISVVSCHASIGAPRNRCGVVSRWHRALPKNGKAPPMRTSMLGTAQRVKCGGDSSRVAISARGRTLSVIDVAKLALAGAVTGAGHGGAWAPIPPWLRGGASAAAGLKCCGIQWRG